MDNLKAWQKWKVFLRVWNWVKMMVGYWVEKKAYVMVLKMAETKVGWREIQTALMMVG